MITLITSTDNLRIENGKLFRELREFRECREFREEL
jgi:hypothetical protein